MAFLTQEQLDALAQFDTPTICTPSRALVSGAGPRASPGQELRMRAAMSDKPMVAMPAPAVTSARQPATPALAR